jgi:glycosyltransferase involved in cell wall biosynthesis
MRSVVIPPTSDIQRTSDDFPITVVTRLLWPGTGRTAVEEARRIPARLLVYRQSSTPFFTDVTGVDLRYLRKLGERGRLTSAFTGLTMLYYAGRGRDATVDLDLIVRASSKVSGPALFHDQFAGLTGYLRRLRFRTGYAVYLHETALGDYLGVRATGSWMMDRALRTYDRTVLSNARLVLTNSRLNASILREAGIASEVVYTGCDPQTQVPDHREPIILATSVWDSTRNMEVYLDLARRTKARVVLAGTWGRPEEMEAFQRKHHGLVEVTGPISEARLRELRQQASVYVRFGFGERGPGQGGIEAMASGMPVITNRELPMSELVDDGVDGFVVGTPEEAAERVNDLLADPSRLQKMGTAAWSKSQGLSWQAHADRVRSLMAAAFS